jgi:hypothetical protein
MEYKTKVEIRYTNGDVLTMKDRREPKEVLEWYDSGMRRKTPMVCYTYDDGGGQIISLANVIRLNILPIKGI